MEQKHLKVTVLLSTKKFQIKYEPTLPDEMLIVEAVRWTEFLMISEALSLDRWPEGFKESARHIFQKEEYTLFDIRWDIHEEHKKLLASTCRTSSEKMMEQGKESLIDFSIIEVD